MPHVMKRNDDHSQRKVQQAIEKTSDFTLAMQIDEELCPDTWLDDVRHPGNQKADHSQLGDGEFHESFVSCRAAASYQSSGSERDLQHPAAATHAQFVSNRTLEQLKHSGER